MRRIKLADGRTVEVDCLSCAVTSGMIEATGGVIYETEHFHAHQDLAYPIPGLVILASKRHLYAVDHLTEVEALAYIQLLRSIRQAQREVLGIQHVYYFYNEDTTHHFHTWMVPRYEWMRAFGRSVESLRPVLLHARNRMNQPHELEQVRQTAAVFGTHLRCSRVVLSVYAPVEDLVELSSRLFVFRVPTDGLRQMVETGRGERGVQFVLRLGHQFGMLGPEILKPLCHLVQFNLKNAPCPGGDRRRKGGPLKPIQLGTRTAVTQDQVAERCVAAPCLCQAPQA
jgi:diadenosine tetraphosphate (Ap4A) HIT family hydrolase